MGDRTKTLLAGKHLSAVTTTIAEDITQIGNKISITQNSEEGSEEAFANISVISVYLFTHGSV